MSLIKLINVGDELIFDLSNVKPGTKNIKVALIEKTGRTAVLKIDTDRSIDVKQIRQVRLP